jgi:hypothetical protein
MRDRLGRLLAIRRLREDLDRHSLQLALDSLAEAESALSRQTLASAEARRESRTALIAGDRCEWLLAEASREVATWNKNRLNLLIRLRTVKVPDAMKQFLESRREHEQVKQLSDHAKEQTKLDTDRTAQVTTDDWILSRLFRTDLDH